ncbi:anti-sigma factor [Noviherbaspirillum malthae]|jgi:anti-sigma-K factor RskA|uniref:anti-sigma factor n=1 Tax=Noviherbaspirillum malthae TaxID=1260987 RepID=UPI00188E2E84|nr:anti-sigma factor [Noviherbaspirillum malthae]
MNYRHNHVLKEKLAAEYALGTLRGGARRRFEAWLKEDAALRRSVAEWQDRLYPLAEIALAVAPPARAWKAIEDRIDAQAAEGRRSIWESLNENFRFWRTLGVASTAVAAMLAAVLLVQRPEDGPAGPSYVAALTDDKAAPAIVITGDPKRRELTIKIVSPQNIAADRSLELWALPRDGAPRSLGLVAANGTVILPLPENVTPETVPALAISLEPKGGSPNPNAPSGPVLYKGAWVGI